MSYVVKITWLVIWKMSIPAQMFINRLLKSFPTKSKSILGIAPLSEIPMLFFGHELNLIRLKRFLLHKKLSNFNRFHSHWFEDQRNVLHCFVKSKFLWHFNLINLNIYIDLMWMKKKKKKKERKIKRENKRKL